MEIVEVEESINTLDGGSPEENAVTDYKEKARPGLWCGIACGGSILHSVSDAYDRF